MLPIVMSLMSTCKFSTSTITPHLYHHDFFLDHLLISMFTNTLMFLVQPTIALLFVLWLAIAILLVILPMILRSILLMIELVNVFLLALLTMNFLLLLNVHLFAKTIQKMMSLQQSFTTQDVRLLHKGVATFLNHHNVSLTS